MTPGPTRLVGTVRLPDGGVAGPLTGRECALALWEIRQGAGSGRLDTELASGYETTPFRLEDGTGAARVEVTGAEEFLGMDLDLADGWDDPVFEVEYGEPRPDAAAALEARADVRDWPDLTPGLEAAAGTRRRYHEWRVERGDEVTVYGHARREDGRTVLAPADDGPFHLTTGNLSRRLAFRTGVLATVGLFLLGVALNEYTVGWRLTPSL